MFMRNRRVIDLTAIEHNMKLIRAAVPQSARMMAVVKADGYGHGAAATAKAAIRGGADMLAVASADEGASLRQYGITVPILVLGAVTASEAKTGVQNNLIQTVCSPEMVSICEKAAEEYQKQTEVHIKIDTGMGRIGIRNKEERDAVLKALSESPHVVLSGVFTHFSDADGDADGEEYTRKQFQEFMELTQVFPEHVIRHCSNSAAIHRFPEMSLDMVRAGISLYGYPPVPTDMPLKPCMSWSAVLSYVKTVPSGAYISYGRTFRTGGTCRIGTVTCGYGDGFLRAAGKKGYVLVRGKKAKIVGRVCMDQMMVDLTDLPDAAVGDEVVLIGRSGMQTIGADDIASWCDTISYEILLSVGSRVQRIYTSPSLTGEE